ncbi:hypothetical protein BN961_03437 [Afipia felis]|uniref:Uncharacterized protein n=1 Tax=Afipia felis TaxID=1035 RepID=A0A090N8E8_AFIFE|nr:hypothetical protein BN961_03437 [Afipia felis]
MQWAATVEGHEVGDVDQRVDRAQSDGRQATLQPFRRRPVLHATHKAQCEAGAQRGVFNRHRRGCCERTLDRLRRIVVKLAHVGRAEVARDAVHAGRVRAVRRQVNFDHRIAEAGPFRVRLADGRVARQFDDAVVIFGEFKFGGRAQHAAALDAANIADAERDVLAGNVGARRREHADQSRARVRRAADHLNRRTFSGIDHAHAQTVGVGMLFGGDDLGDDVRRQRLRLILEVFDL